MATSADESTNQSMVSMDQSQEGLQNMDQSQDGFQNMDQSDNGLFTTKGENSDSSDEDLESYYFESDHVALKGNRDYHILLRAIALLEAQRVQAAKDLDLLYEGKREAVADPIRFVEKLQRGVDLKLPKPQKVAELPNINWESYTSQLDFSTFGTHRHMTRLKRQLVDGNKPPMQEDTKPLTAEEAVVRGRVKTENKPDTFNQLWTVEEQKRLEELLIMYPPEEVEARRFQKIADALGNRTAKQVQSRVQKYFIKLAKAGLPIPGRAPHPMALKQNKPGSRYRGWRTHHQPYQLSSTFMASVVPPVLMNEDDDDYSSQGYDAMSAHGDFDTQEDCVSDDETIPLELRDTPEYREMMHLKLLRARKLKKSAAGPSEHIGFKCDRCDCEPIVGTRWHCSDCPPDVAVDFCEGCVDSGFETATHNTSHRLKPKHKPETSGYMDNDYLGLMPGGYNYLDPNYMPAS